MDSALDQTREHARPMGGVGRDVKVEVLGFFIEGGGKVPMVCNCHGKIHEVTCG